MAHKKWIVANADKNLASELSEKLNIDSIISYLLVSRGFTDELSAEDFLYNDNSFISPFSLKDMDKAVNRINRAVENGEKICIYGDYDCDGVTSVALLYSFLESYGADVIYYIPNRLTEGYGMNTDAIDKLKALGTELIITVDNGISAVDEAEYIYSLGMELVITDHHQIGERLPRACAVVNPHREDNDISFRDFAGVGIAFKLVCAIYDGETEDMIEHFADLVAIGTIGDVVPLLDENRRLVKYGLNLINSGSRLGIAALKQVISFNDDFTAHDVAFKICPRINAAGRMDTPQYALDLLLSDDSETAEFKAEQLNVENQHRQEVCNEILEDIAKTVSKNPLLVNDRVIVLDGRGYHHGVIGIVASNILTKYGKPTIIISTDENGESTGSARSIEGFNIYEAIASCSDMLTHFGGHPLAAGLGINEKDIPLFRKRINEFALKHNPVMPCETLKIDCRISPAHIDLSLINGLGILEPCGKDNASAVFGIFNVRIVKTIPLSEGKHIKLVFSKKDHRTYEALLFNTNFNEFAYKAGDVIDLAVRLSVSTYRGAQEKQIRVVDIRRHGCDDEKYFREKTDYEQSLFGKTELIKCPNRDTFASLYRFLKKEKSYKCTLEELYFALSQEIPYGTLMYALDALEEVGILSRDNGLTLNVISGKADLENTKTLKALRKEI